jgi:hypothetical protein
VLLLGGVEVSSAVSRWLGVSRDLSMAIGGLLGCWGLRIERLGVGSWSVYSFGQVYALENSGALLWR